MQSNNIKGVIRFDKKRTIELQWQLPLKQLKILINISLKLSRNHKAIYTKIMT